MKRISIISLCTVILLTLLFTACQKEQEGVYNPKKKIERIYTESHFQSHEDDFQDDEVKHLSELWDWNGNQLSSITYYNPDGTVAQTATFSYDGNRISQIRLNIDHEYDYYYYFTYQNDLINTIQIFGEQEALYTYRFVLSGDKITRIEMIDAYEGGDKQWQCSHISPLRFILPAMNLNYTFFEQCKKSSTKKLGDILWSYELVWNQDNITKITCTSGNYSQIYEYAYDTKMNPLYSSFMGYHDYRYGLEADTYIPWVTSKNNVISVSFNDFEGWEYTEDYSYSYEEDYPVSYTVNGTQPMGTWSAVVYYEYK